MDKISLDNDIKNGFSSYQLSKKYGKGQTTILYWLKKFGLKTQFKKIGSGYKKSSNKTYEQINWEFCQNLYDSGCTYRDLINKGYSSCSLQWAKKYKKIKFRSCIKSRLMGELCGKYDYSIYKTEDFRKKHIKCGGYREGSGRCNHILYTRKNGSKITLQGKWELKVAEFLDRQNVNWEKNRIGYKYHFDRKDRLYYPDFWLKDLNLYVEVKGYETEKDREKWKQFPFKLLIIKKKEINDLDEWKRNYLVDNKQV